MAWDYKPRGEFSASPTSMGLMGPKTLQFSPSPTFLYIGKVGLGLGTWDFCVWMTRHQPPLFKKGNAKVIDEA
jgi:hypothetical protein